MSRPESTSPPSLLPEQGGIGIAPGVHISSRGLRIQFSRGGGPGGQNVNKLNTRAEIWVQLTEISGLSASAVARLRTMAGRRLTDADELHLISETHRTQDGNRREVFRRLRELLIQAGKEPRPRRKTRPTASSRRRRLQSKRRRSELKAKRSGRDY
jgi:ribosome-associated protein